MESEDLDPQLESPLLQESGANADGEETHENSRETPPETEDGSVTTTPCWKSAQFLELAMCFGFWVGTYTVFQYGPFSPHERPIPFQLLEKSGDYVRNLTVDESREGDSVSASVLVCLAHLIQQIFCLTQKLRGKQTTFLDAHATLCAFLLATTLNRISTESVKNYAGYLRPVFYEECGPSGDYSECIGDDASDSMRKSFPSGHASMSFCGFTLLTLYIHARFGMGHQKRMEERQRFASFIAESDESNPDESTQVSSRPSVSPINMSSFRARVISTLGLLPMACALYISAQRVRYNMHFPADVVGGAVLGGSIAVFVHGLWF